MTAVSVTQKPLPWLVSVKYFKVLNMSWAEERRVQREKSHDVVSGCDWELEVEGAVSVWVATKRGKDCVLMKYVSVDLEWNVKFIHTKQVKQAEGRATTFVLMFTTPGSQTTLATIHRVTYYNYSTIPQTATLQVSWEINIWWMQNDGAECSVKIIVKATYEQAFSGRGK